MANDPDLAENWALVNTPLGEEWSGRARYAAAMYFHKRGDMGHEALEVYRLCSRLDYQDPLAIMRDRGVGKRWLERLANATSAPDAPRPDGQSPARPRPGRRR